VKKLRKTTSVYNIPDVLTVTLKVIEERKEYISQKTASTTNEIPTSKFVLQHLPIFLELPNAEKNALNEKYHQKVKEIQDYFSLQPRDPNDSFLATIHDLMGTGMSSERMLGFIVALPWMYETHYTRTSKLMKLAEKYSSSNYMGTIGDRETFIVKLIDVSNFKKIDEKTGEIVTLYVYRISDQIGNIGLFFSKHPPSDTISSVETLNIQLWDCFEFSGTPKKNEPNIVTGIKETQFTSVKITEFIGRGSEE
jgi:hypothetical protein